jgi:DNA replication protein DnaC
MNETQALEHASVKQYCKALRVPMIGAHFVQLAEQAIKEQRSLRNAKLPRLKTLEEFDFNQARQIPAAKIRELAEGGYIERAEPVVLMGECGTGKTHLATGLCVAACRQKRRARFTMARSSVARGTLVQRWKLRLDAGGRVQEGHRGRSHAVLIVVVPFVVQSDIPPSAVALFH